MTGRPRSFWVLKVDGDCWIYHTSSGRPHRNSRGFWEQAYGRLESDQWVLHTCDVEECINPDHLYLGRMDWNVEDMFRRGRARPEARWNARRQLTAEQVMALRCMAAEGASWPNIGRWFGVSPWQASRIARGTRRPDVPMCGKPRKTRSYQRASP